jgi:broad specificity phosphatase PhoE
MTLRLYLIRHGKATTAATLQPVEPGRTADGYDVLHPIGHEQSQRLGASLVRRGQDFDHVVCGPMQRHRTTLECMRHGAAEQREPWPTARIVDDAREVALDLLSREHLPRIAQRDDRTRGWWSEARTHADVASEASGLAHLVAILTSEWKRGELTTEGVETWKAFRQRASRLLDQLVSSFGSGGKVALITSLGVINALLDAATGVSPEDTSPFRWFATSSVSRLDYDAGGFTVGRVNDVTHLDGAPELLTLF